MIRDAEIEVLCDRCGDSLYLTLTPIARGGWDERSLMSDLLVNGWVAVGSQQYCPDCAETLPGTLPQQAQEG